MGEADVVVGFGCSFTTWTTRGERLFAPDATVVQVDVEPTALGLSDRVDLAVLGDCDQTAQAVLEALGEPGEQPPGWRRPPVAARIRAGDDAAPPKPLTAASQGVVHPAELSGELERMLPSARTVVVDGGHFLGWPVTCWSV